LSAPKSGVHRLAHLEVVGPEFYLQDNVFVERAVEGHEVVVGRARAIHRPVAPVLRAIVNKAAPDNFAAVRRDRLRKHVGAVNMGAPVLERPWLAFGIGFDQKARKVGNVAVDKRGALLPPRRDRGIQRVCGGEFPQRPRRAEVDAQKQPYAEGPEDRG